jgi:hypothetical protein
MFRWVRLGQTGCWQSFRTVQPSYSELISAYWVKLLDSELSAVSAFVWDLMFHSELASAFILFGFSISVRFCDHSKIFTCIYYGFWIILSCGKWSFAHLSGNSTLHSHTQFQALLVLVRLYESTTHCAYPCTSTITYSFFIFIYYTGVGLGFKNCEFLRAAKSHSKSQRIVGDVPSWPQLFKAEQSCSNLQNDSCQMSLFICLHPSGTYG